MTFMSGENDKIVCLKNKKAAEPSKAPQLFTYTNGRLTQPESRQDLGDKAR